MKNEQDEGEILRKIVAFIGWLILLALFGACRRLWGNV